MKYLFILILFLNLTNCFCQYNYGLEVDQFDAKIDGKLNLFNGNTSVIIGNNAGVQENNQFAFANTFIGEASGLQVSTSQGNTFIGFASGVEMQNSNSDENTFIGKWSGEFHRSGTGNTYIGTSTGGTNWHGNYNVCLGYQAGPNSGGSINSLNGSHNIYIGSYAGNNGGIADAADDYKLWIETDPMQQDDPLIYGEFDNDYLKINGTLHIKEIVKLEPQLTTPTTCDPQSMGTMYTDTNGILYFCDGTSWKTIQLN